MRAGWNSGPDASPRAWFVCSVLLVLMILSHLDRAILALMVEPIKADLGLSDSRFGLLFAAFAVFHAILGLPTGRWIDRRSRRAALTLGLSLWTAATMACGFVTGFGQLLVARVMVSAGETTLTPAGTSLIADLFPPARRGLALGIFTSGIYLGSALALVGGGLLLQHLTPGGLVVGPVHLSGWRTVFVVAGLLGFPALALLLLLREPPRADDHATVPASIMETLRVAGQIRRALLGHFFGFALISFAANAVASWLPAYLHRQFGWGPGTIGPIYGVVLIAFGPVGTISGGLLCDALKRRGRDDAPLIIGVLSVLGTLPFAIMLPFAPSGSWAVGAAAGFVFFTSFNWAMAPGALAAIAPNRMRAQAVSAYLLVSNIVGVGLGPLVLAYASDHFGLRAAIAGAIPCALLFGGTILWITRKPFVTAVKHPT